MLTDALIAEIASGAKAHWLGTGKGPAGIAEWALREADAKLALPAQSAGMPDMAKRYCVSMGAFNNGEFYVKDVDYVKLRTYALAVVQKNKELDATNNRLRLSWREDTAAEHYRALAAEAALTLANADIAVLRVEREDAHAAGRAQGREEAAAFCESEAADCRKLGIHGLSMEDCAFAIRNLPSHAPEEAAASAQARAGKEGGG